MSIGTIRTWLYWWAKILGDVSAVRQGPRLLLLLRAPQVQ